MVYPGKIPLWAALSVMMGHMAVAQDTQLSGSEITALLGDHSLYAGSNGEIEQIFQKQGLTFYLQNKASSQGTWRVRDNLYCSIWPPNPAESCFTVLRNGDAVTFVSSAGKHFGMVISKPK